MDDVRGSDGESEEVGITVDPFYKVPHIESLYKAADILEESEVVATEKLDGTSGRVGIVDATFRVGSRSRILSEFADNSDFYKYVVREGLEKRIQDRIPDDIKAKSFIVYGEYLGSGISGKINYHKHRKFYAYQIRIGLDFINYDDFVKYCALLEIDICPLIFRGKPDRQQLVEMRIGKSLINPEEPREGIVISTVTPKKDYRDNWMFYKLKSPEYEERSSLQHKTPNLDNSTRLAARDFANEFVTVQRLEHVLAQLKERGVVVSGMQQTREVMEEMQKDCLREGQAQIPEGSDTKILCKEIGAKTVPLLKVHLGIAT